MKNIISLFLEQKWRARNQDTMMKYLILYSANGARLVNGRSKFTVFHDVNRNVYFNRFPQPIIIIIVSREFNQPWK